MTLEKCKKHWLVVGTNNKILLLTHNRKIAEQFIQKNLQRGNNDKSI